MKQRLEALLEERTGIFTLWNIHKESIDPTLDERMFKSIENHLPWVDGKMVVGPLEPLLHVIDEFKVWVFVSEARTIVIGGQKELLGDLEWVTSQIVEKEYPDEEFHFLNKYY